MKQFTYTISGDEDKLLFEKVYDENGRLLHKIDYSQLPSEETIYTFNDQGQLIREVMLNEGRIYDEHEYDFNEKGEIVEQRHHINGDLYEKVVREITDFGFQHRTIQDEEEIERKEHEGDANQFTIRYFEYGEWTETHVHTYDLTARTRTILVTFPGSDAAIKRVEEYDEKDQLVAEVLYHANGEIQQEWKRSVGDDNEKMENLVDHDRPENTFRLNVISDSNGNVISKEKWSIKDNLLAFEKNNYDDENRLVETVKMNGQTKVHLRFEYHD
jgi:antitoxin component YwqK of YwqJK toxin-antitoxin module